MKKVIQLNTIIKKLKEHIEVDAVFITGSYGEGKQKPYSDLDLIIILKKNKQHIRSIFTWIDGIFSDIFFFDSFDLKRMKIMENFEGMDAVFISWLKNADIKFDKSGTTTALHDQIHFPKFFVAPNEQWKFWQKINYNYITNKRYFESNDPWYHEALEFRLLYSTIEIITGYFSFRNILWKGEKFAVTYLKEHDQIFYKFFVRYSKANNLKQRFYFYSQMAKKVFPSKYTLWTKKDVIPMSKKDDSFQQKSKLIKYWKSLIN